MGWFTRWRRSRVLRKRTIDDRCWKRAVSRYEFIQSLDADERARLRDWVVLFLAEKSLHGAGGLALREEMRIAIAAQACILILNLDLDYYRGWEEVIVYPDEFVAEYEHVDEAGVVHVIREPMSGESWLQGPVILSWADMQEGVRGGGYNVVIHEFAHKLDMVNGDANGFPPLHPDMNPKAWSTAFHAAYEMHCAAVDRNEETVLDPYAAENPSEFFAVASEAFFETPGRVKTHYPAVYDQLVGFYRQDPARRHGGRA